MKVSKLILSIGLLLSSINAIGVIDHTITANSLLEQVNFLSKAGSVRRDIARALTSDASNIVKIEFLNESLSTVEGTHLENQKLIRWVAVRKGQLKRQILIEDN